MLIRAWGSCPRPSVSSTTVRPPDRLKRGLSNPALDVFEGTYPRPARGGGRKRLTDRLVSASALVDLRGFDLRRVGVDVDPVYTSTNDASAEEAHDVDDLAFLGKPLAAVLVEHVNRVRRILRDERNVEGPGLGHRRTMAGKG